MNQSFWNKKNIVITGGTSGLGKELALELVARNARVVVVGRRQQLLNEIKRTSPGLIDIRGDVADKESIYPLAGEIHSQLGSVDFLFNNASYVGVTPLRLLMDTECEDFEQVLQTNLLAPFRLTKALTPSMLLKGAGTVVNISSDAAVHPYPTWGSYSVSKAALDHLTRIFAAELASFGVRFFAIDPGDMDTPMHLAAIPDAVVSDLRTPREVAIRILNFLETTTSISERVKA